MIRFAAVQAVGQRIAQARTSTGDRHLDASNAAQEIVEAAVHVAEYIRSGRTHW